VRREGTKREGGKNVARRTMVNGVISKSHGNSGWVGIMVTGGPEIFAGEERKLGGVQNSIRAALDTKKALEAQKARGILK